MPIYLVRWPSLTVSLIRARSEAHLMDIIDETSSPAGCVWSIYRGPLVIDLAVPLKLEIAGGVAGRTRAEDVTVSGELDIEHGEALEVRASDDCETSHEMREAILRQAFPAIAALFYDSSRDELSAAEVQQAAAQDIEAQAREAESVGITLGEESELCGRSRGAFARWRPRCLKRLRRTSRMTSAAVRRRCPRTLTAWCILRMWRWHTGETALCRRV